MYISDAIGLSALFNIAIVIICIGICWWALQSLRLDVFLKNPGQVQARFLHVVLAVVLGYQLGRFVIEYAVWSSQLGSLF